MFFYIDPQAQQPTAVEVPRVGRRLPKKVRKRHLCALRSPADEVFEHGLRVVGLRDAGGQQDAGGAEVAGGDHVVAGRDAGTAEHVDGGIDGLGGRDRVPSTIPGSAVETETSPPMSSGGSTATASGPSAAAALRRLAGVVRADDRLQFGALGRVNGAVDVGELQAILGVVNKGPLPRRCRRRPRRASTRV